ncbi:MAG TPA: Gfo/Idh/MocA family oxidoreductase [Candidatus Binatia bacterium]
MLETNSRTEPLQGERLSLGIAGLGNAGHAVLRDLDKVAGVELVAVADVRNQALETFPKENGMVRTYDSVAKMCGNEKVDAVWVATPTEFHTEHVITALERGKHVICEKPMALSLDDCDRIIEAAEKNRLILLMHSKAMDPPIVKMREVIAGGELGRVIQINTWSYKGWLKSVRLPSEVDSARGGGVLFRQGPHQVDIVRAIGGGRVRSVRGTAGKWHPRFDTEGNFTAMLEFEDGTPATLVFNGYGFFDTSELTWGIGEGGYQVSRQENSQADPQMPVDASVRYSMPLRTETRRRVGERKQPVYGLTLVSCEKGDMRQSPDGVYVYTRDGCREIPCPAFLDRGETLLKLVEAATEHRPVPTDGRWGKATLEVLLAILQSSREGREITLTHQVRSVA